MVVTKVPKTKMFGGKRYRIQTATGTGYASEVSAVSLAKEFRAAGMCARVVKYSIQTRTEKRYGKKPLIEWHVYAR